MNIKMLALDLDRTLLRADKSISDETAAVLRECRARGILVVFATARAESFCDRFVEQIAPDGVICNSGALVRLGGKTVARAVLDAPTVDAFLLACAAQPSISCITVDTDRGFFVNRQVDEDDPEWVDYLPAYYADFSQGLGMEADKIAIETPCADAVRALSTAFPALAVTPFSGEGWFCFADAAANKWDGVQAFADAAGIDVAQVAAFGDDYSDIAMLRGCGVGVAVGNAIAQVKAAADVVCGYHDSDGVAVWIRENVL